jgi:hypothetical protein
MLASASSPLGVVAPPLGPPELNFCAATAKATFRLMAALSVSPHLGAAAFRLVAAFFWVSVSLLVTMAENLSRAAPEANGGTGLAPAPAGVRLTCHNVRSGGVRFAGRSMA